MEVLNDVLGGSDLPEPPMRDIDGVVTQVRVRRIPNMHALTSEGVNEGESEEARRPASEQPLLTRLDETRLAELIEQHDVDYIDGEGRSVHLAAPFVKHFHTRTDDAPAGRVSHRHAADRTAGRDAPGETRPSIASTASSFECRPTCWHKFRDRRVARPAQSPRRCASWSRNGCATYRPTMPANAS